MARHETNNTITHHVISDDDMPTLPTMRDAVNFLDAAQSEAYDNALALAKQISYDGPLTVGGAEDRLRQGMRRTINECLEMGKTLLILKELVAHGEFQQRVGMLGLGYQTGKKFMAATLKFSKGYSNTLLAAGSQTKMLELLVLDDGEIEALESGDTVRGITLDKIETLSVSELKKALRDANGRLDAKESVIAGKDQKINEQAEKLALLEQKKPVAAEIQERYMPGHVELEALQEYANSVASRVSATVRSEIVKLFDIYGNEPPAHIRLAAAQALGLIVTAAYGVAEDLFLTIDTNPEAATDNPAKRDAEEFMAWQQAQSAE